MMAPKGAEIDITIFIILTDFVTLNKFCVPKKNVSSPGKIAPSCYYKIF